MPAADSKHPRPACVEDWDDDAQTTLSYTKATANVAVRRQSSGLYGDPSPQLRYNRDGSDSGYSSKAATVASASTGGKKPPNLSIDTSLPERERQPYAMTPQAKRNVRRDSYGRPSTAEYVQTPVREKPFRHETGICYTCDRFGRHLSQQELDRIKAAPTPTSSKATTKSGRSDQESETKLRRMSSTRESGPVSGYPPSATQPFYSTAPVYTSLGYGTPLTPQMSYATTPIVYTYNPPTPITSTYVGYPGQADYFASQPTQEERPPNPKRRSTGYGDPVIQQSRKEEPRVVEKLSNNDVRPNVKSHKPTRSVDQQRADREAMPPPSERPSQRTEVARRPSIKKSATYNASLVDHRRSRGSEDYDYREVRQASPVRESRPPPSAYKSVTQSEQAPIRPQVRRKSVSYSDPIATTKVSSSKTSDSVNHPRRNTAPTKQPSSLEQKTANAEAYQRKSRMTSEELTHEKILEMKSSKRTVSSRSETGSAISYQSHQSSSKASSGRGRSHTSGQRTSILLEGGIKLDIPKDYLDRTGRPLSMQFGDLSISVGSKDKVPSSSSKRDQRMIEKAPSVASHQSKRSITDSSHTSSKGKEKYRDEEEEVSRKSSHVSDSRPPVTSSNHGHSHRSSRASSSTRANVEPSRIKRQSTDYDQNRFVYGA